MTNAVNKGPTISPTYPILVIWAPLKRSRSGLSNGGKIVQKYSIFAKLRQFEVFWRGKKFNFLRQAIFKSLVAKRSFCPRRVRNLEK